MRRSQRLVFLFFGVFLQVQAWNVTINPNEERLLNRRSGDNFLVVCKVKGFDGAASDVVINWYRNDNIIAKFGPVMTIERPYSSQLLINRPKTTDSGKYTCKVSIHDQQQEIKADISFVDPPKFVDPKTVQNPIEGTTAEIVCKVEGSENLEVFWQYHGSTIDDTSKRGYEFSEDRQTLYIPHYTMADDGLYNCNAAQFSSFETLTINVTGYARPRITVFETPSNNRGFEGHTVELKCGAIGKPKPSYKWYFEDNENPIEHSDKYKVEDSGLLIIESLNSEDGGTYKCVANNTVGTDVRTVAFSVFLKPKVDIQNEYVKKEDDNLEIICNYNGEGKLSAKFVYGNQEYSIKNDNSIESTENDEPETSTVDISVASLENEGLDNDEDDQSDNEDVSASTLPAPISIENSNENENEEIDEVEEENRWRRFVEAVNSERVTIRSEQNKLILSIEKVSFEDAGPYECVVSNEAGSVNKTTKVSIIHPPFLRHYSGNVRSYDRTATQLYCGVSAVPEAKWTWFKNGVEVEANGASIQIDSQNSTSKLTLEHDENSDNYGNYTCKADNGVGVLEKHMEVIKIVPPATPIGINCKKMMYPNFGRCSFEDGLYINQSSQPLQIQFLIAKLSEMESDFNWNDALPMLVDYSNDTTIPNLDASTQYMVKASAINEAGKSEYSEEVSLETSDPWVPKEPDTVRMECSSSCIVSWTVPNDNGSPIQKYRIVIQEQKKVEESIDANAETTTEKENLLRSAELEIDSENAKNLEDSTEINSTPENNDDFVDFEDEKQVEQIEKVNIGKPFIIDVGTDETELQLTHIKPHSFYKISVSALNAVGEGEPFSIEYQTDGNPSSYEDMVTSSAIVAGIIIILFLFIVIDFICYLTNRCGFISCICLNYCGKSNTRTQRDVEASKGPENNRLLDSSATR